MAFLTRFLDFLIPPLCPCCDHCVGEDQTVCADCFRSLRFIDDPCCSLCGLPFDFTVEEGTVCGACLEETPIYKKARSALIYDEASKPLVLRLKHADQIHFVPLLASWLERAGKDLFHDVDVIVPVPLHRFRLWSRRYNQSALLAQHLGRRTGLPVILDGLKRTRATPTQGRRGHKERYENVRGAFVASSKMTGQSILLVDDVLTSGATITECSRALYAQGASTVCVLTLSRVHKTS